MDNPIEINAAKIITVLFENNPEEVLYFDGTHIYELTGLSPVEINNAVDYLDDKSLIERLNYLGTTPYKFGAVRLNSRGNFVYHELKNATIAKGSEPPDKILSKQPLAAGSPYGFTDQDWEYVQQELAKETILKVVFGHAFKSEYYKSGELQKNVRAHFKTAVAIHNTKPGAAFIKLNFQSLAAGYGEHLFNQIARDIISADIAVFDTSDLNPNVMLEVGVALTWGKRVLLVKTKGCVVPPSDISGQTYADYINDGEIFISDHHNEAMLAMIERAIMKKRVN